MIWEGEVVREHELLGGTAAAGGAREAEEIEAGRLAFAVEFLKWELGNGPQATTEVLQEAREQGIALRTLERAKHALKTESYYDEEEEEWMVRWPGAEGDDEGVEGNKSPSTV